MAKVRRQLPLINPLVWGSIPTPGWHRINSCIDENTQRAVERRVLDVLRTSARAVDPVFDHQQDWSFR